MYEMFGRHLFQLPGFSAERAAAVLEVYPTPTQYARISLSGNINCSL